MNDVHVWPSFMVCGKSPAIMVIILHMSITLYAS